MPWFVKYTPQIDWKDRSVKLEPPEDARDEPRPIIFRSNQDVAWRLTAHHGDDCAKKPRPKKEKLSRAVKFAFEDDHAESRDQVEEAPPVKTCAKSLAREMPGEDEGNQASKELHTHYKTSARFQLSAASVDESESVLDVPQAQKKSIASHAGEENAEASRIETVSVLVQTKVGLATRPLDLESPTITASEIITPSVIRHNRFIRQLRGEDKSIKSASS